MISLNLLDLGYHKILKISPRGLNFSKALFERLIFGGAHLRRERCVSKSIGLVLLLEVNLPFLLCFTLFLRAIFLVRAPGGLFLEGLIYGGKDAFQNRLG